MTLDTTLNSKTYFLYHRVEIPQNRSIGAGQDHGTDVLSLEETINGVGESDQARELKQLQEMLTRNFNTLVKTFDVTYLRHDSPITERRTRRTIRLNSATH